MEELVARSPHLDRFIRFPGYPGMAEQFLDAREATRFFARTQDEQFDLALQMNDDGATAPITDLIESITVDEGLSPCRNLLYRAQGRSAAVDAASRYACE